jgi:phosphopentomutase
MPNIEVVGCYGKIMMAKFPAKVPLAGHWIMSGTILKKSFPTYPKDFLKK